MQDDVFMVVSQRGVELQTYVYEHLVGCERQCLARLNFERDARGRLNLLPVELCIG
jgi:hypothetical protein